MEVSCTKIKLKPNSIAQVKEWAKLLNDKKSEVYKTLADEGVYLEFCFLEQSDTGDYLIYGVKCESIEKMKKVGGESTHEIDKFHQQFKKDTWEGRTKLENLIWFEQDN